MKPVELFAGRYVWGIDFLNALDRAMRILGMETGPYAVAVNYTFNVNDSIDSIQANASGGAVTITLPSPTGLRRRRVLKTDSSVNAVTVNGAGALINGAATYSLPAQYNYVEVEPTGDSWLVIANGP